MSGACAVEQREWAHQLINSLSRVLGLPVTLGAPYQNCILTDKFQSPPLLTDSESQLGGHMEVYGKDGRSTVKVRGVY